MVESNARRRSREAKGQPTEDAVAKADPTRMQITFRGYTLVADPVDLTSAEKQRWRAYVAQLGPQADEADHFLALITVLIQRVDSEWTWDFAKNNVKWREVIDAIAAGTVPEADHPQ